MKKPNDSFFGKLMQGLFAFFVLYLLQKFFPENERVEESECGNREGGEEKKETALPKGGVEQTEGQDQPLVIEAEKAERCTMPAGSGREGRKRGKRGILDRIRGLSPEARYRVGNTGLILLQVWVFFVTNFLANFSDWWGNRSPQEAMWLSAPIAFLFIFWLIMYYIPVWDKEKNPPRLVVGLFFVAVVAAIPAGVEACSKFDQADSSWWKALKLAIGTGCQGFAGYIAWKAADLIPAPSAGNSKELE